MTAYESFGLACLVEQVDWKWCFWTFSIFLVVEPVKQAPKSYLFYRLLITETLSYLGFPWCIRPETPWSCHTVGPWRGGNTWAEYYYDD